MSPSARLFQQLAHDLRSPLNVIDNTLTELTDTADLTGADREQILRLSQRAVKRLIMLSDRLFLAARLEEPGFAVALGPVDFAQTTQETVTQFLAEQQRKGVDVARVNPNAPMMIRGDRALLRSMLLELLSNAHRCTRKHVRVELCEVGGSAVLSVEDDGPGVNEAERALLFQSFAERSSATGLGMGLWLARRLAEEHQGTLTVEGLSPGTRQRFVVPLA